MGRKITIEAGGFELPIDLQATQEVDAHWNGQTIDLSLNLVFDGQLEILRTPISLAQARLLVERLQSALNKAS